MITPDFVPGTMVTIDPESTGGKYLGTVYRVERKLKVNYSIVPVNGHGASLRAPGFMLRLATEQEIEAAESAAVAPESRLTPGTLVMVTNATGKLQAAANTIYAVVRVSPTTVTIEPCHGGGGGWRIAPQLLTPITLDDPTLTQLVKLAS